MTDDGTGTARTTTLLTIGAFARTSRLSIKALRIYDEIGLLPPVRIDPATGYRYYDRAQLDRARLVAWLRRLDMPLARIRLVCDLCDTDRTAAAAEIREFWTRVEADVAARRELVDFLVGQLSLSLGKDPIMPRTAHPVAEPLEIRYAALSDAGTVRPTNQDAAYADPRLFAVADGFGEQGDAASRSAIGALREIDVVETGDLLNVLKDAVRQANEVISAYEAGTGTTLTAMLWTGSQLGLVHIGDSRAYLLRDDRFFRITHDHTLVQSMVDEGRITPQEAESHPQRSLLLRALGAGASASTSADASTSTDASTSNAAAEPQLHVADVQAGDRYLLCTDGLSANVAEAEIRRVLQGTSGDPAAAVSALIELSNRAGGSDNVACVVADVVVGAE